MWSAGPQRRGDEQTMTMADDAGQTAARRVRARRHAGLPKWARRVWHILVRPGVPGARLAKQIEDFVGGGRALFWQRQGMYMGSALLAGFYYDLMLAIVFMCMLQVTEVLDTWVSTIAVRRAHESSAMARRMQGALLLTSSLSALTVSAFTVAVAVMEGPGQHLTPLFFLFAAGLFAAVNNHQLPRVLFVRLLIYGAVFIYVPVRDLLIVRPALSSELWMQLATVLFVLFFVIECSVIFLRLYRKGLDSLDELRRERDRAQAALEVKSQFVSTVSHELRTPLTSILGSLSLAQTGAFDKDPARMQEVIEIAYKNSKRLQELINDLLDLQKIESGQMRYSFDSVNLGELVAESVCMMHGYAQQSDVILKIEAQDANAWVNGDKGRISQVMNNLLSNAVKFSSAGGTVRVSVRRHEGKALVSVADSGIGIPPGSRELVFGTFSQVDSSDHRAHQGTGLGLSITEKIVVAHGGSIDYDSTLGEGTVFTVALDLIEHPAAAAIAAA